MAVRVVTDSGSDIPEDLVQELGITVVPLTVSFGSTSYRDGVDISGDEFYTRLTLEETMPTTSQPSVGSFVEVYQPIKESGDEILSIHVSSKLSGTLNSATQAAAQEELGPLIELVDSSQASMGVGFSVIAAATAAKNGASLSEARAIAESVLSRTRVLILFETLKYLEKGGRIGKASALLGGILQLKPILTLDDGEIATKSKIRTFKKGIASLLELTKEYGNLQEAAVLYTTDSSDAEALGHQIGSQLPDASQLKVLRISPAVGTHGGPGLVGIICVLAE